MKAPKHPKAHWIRRLLDLAVVSGLVALALMVWSIHGTTPLLLIVAMTVGQGLGILSFAAFLAVVIIDLIRNRVFGGGAPAAAEARSDGPGDSGGDEAT
jgi:hypothetical protein